MQADVRVPEQVEAFVNACVERYEHIDIAFNNAGVVFGLGNLQGNMPLDEIDIAAYDDVLSTNTRGVFSRAQARGSHHASQRTLGALWVARRDHQHR